MLLHDAAALAVATSPEISNRKRDLEILPVLRCHILTF
jgi:hypothetical protein